MANRVIAAFVAFAALSSACSQAELSGPSQRLSTPPAGVIITEDCPTTPTPQCTPLAANAGGCVGEPDQADSGASRIPTDASYPLGCTVDIPASYRTPQGECLVGWSCECVRPGAVSDDADGSVSTQWECAR